MERKGIVVVDDNKDSRNLLNDFLMRDDKDYAVIVFENGELAWQFMEECGELIDLVMTDYEMPRMNGMELLRSIKKIYPEVKVVVMSGLSVATLALETGADAFLKKPFKLEWIQETVHRLLS